MPLASGGSSLTTRVVCPFNPMLSVVITTLLVLLASSSAPTPALDAADAPPARGELLQFTAAGHVLGFQRDGMYVASADHMLKVTFANARGVEPVADLTGFGKPVRSDAAQPLTRVTYPNVWDGIDVRYEAVSGGVVKSTYIVAPGADVAQIRLRYNVPVTVESNGSLRLAFETGEMQESAPVAWQEIAGARVPIQVAFQTSEVSETSEVYVGFALGEYNRAYPLVIDPTLLWHTFLGSGALDAGNGITVDGSGNIYVVGESYGSWGMPVNAWAGSGDAFVAKLNGNGVRQWHTFLGGSNVDHSYGVAVDGNGNVYVAGYSKDTWGKPVNAHAGGWADAFVAKLNSNGARQWHTFMGSGSNCQDEAKGIGIDGSGNIYVVGFSGATWGSPVNAHAGNDDAFVAKFDNSSGVWQWNTFLGSVSNDWGTGIAVDGSGNVYVVGTSYYDWGAALNAFAGGYDAFAAKLNSSGVRQWNTFLGSARRDDGTGIAVDRSENVYVIGRSEATWGTPVNAHAGGLWGVTDAFAAKLNGSGARQWHTFLGSTESDDGTGIAVDGRGNVYIVGSSDATWGTPTPVSTFLPPDAFVARLNGSDGVRQWHTFLGSGSPDQGKGIAAGGSGNVYVVGHSGYWGTPIYPAQGEDVFVAKLAVGGVDIGFRPNPNGYQFPNYGGFNPSDFTMADMRRMFGDSAVCVMVSSRCQPKPSAIMWNVWVNRYMIGGHCDGFTETSLRFFKGIDNPSTFQSGANTTHDLQLNNVRRHIAYYWALGVPDPVSQARVQALQKTPGQVLDQLLSAMSGSVDDPTTLIFYEKSDWHTGHSVTPHAIQDQGGGTRVANTFDHSPKFAIMCLRIDEATASNM
jgi:hypothetical protein